MPRIAATPVATLADLRRVTPWLWVICARCLRRTPTALAQWIIRWGPDSSSDMLRRSARCPQCGGKGAAIQIPGWGGLQTPVRGWPRVAT
jgi:DNA-directed RNA polymerase subunit RPC12/RpoP